MPNDGDDGGGENRPWDGSARVGGLLTQYGSGFEPDEPGEGEDDGEEQSVGRWKVLRIERLERDTGVAAFCEDDDRQQKDCRHSGSAQDELRACREANVEEGKEEQTAEQDKEALKPARAPARVLVEERRHRYGADAHDEGDPHGEGGPLQPPADEPAIRV
jgi:hypothetical protein